MLLRRSSMNSFQAVSGLCDGQYMITLHSRCLRTHSVDEEAFYVLQMLRQTYSIEI